ncbi:MAG: DUF1559 domain-containing protein [Thermoguttaceae bacterium]|nr:DUF1559 domain-containing protein [Thermoguttaceae bacterium]
MRRNLVNALSTVLLGAAFFAAASPVSEAQPTLRRQAQAQTQTAPKTNAYSRIKAFVDGDAFLVARLDLTQIDLEALDKTVTKIFIETLERQDFDAGSIKTARREFNQTFNAVKKFAEPKLTQIREETGLREIYFVVPRSTEKEFFVYAPLAKSKRAAVLELVAPFAQNEAFEVGSGVAFGTKKFNAAYFERFQATPNPKLESFLGESTATLQIFVGDFNVAPAVALAGNDAAKAFAAKLAAAPRETRSAVETFDTYFVDGRVELDVNALKASARFDFASADAANKVRVGLEKLAEVGVADFEKALVAKTAEKNAAEFEKYNVVPVARELLRGFLTSSLPKRDGAALTFELQAGPTLPLANPLTGALIGAALPRALEKVEDAGAALQNAAKNAILPNDVDETAETNEADSPNKSENATDSQNFRNLQQLGLATHNFLDANVPSGQFASPLLPARYSVDADGKPLHSWRVFLLPYVGQKELYDKIRLDEPWDSEHNRQFHDQTPAIYCRPDAPESGCVYACVADETALLQPASETGSMTGIKLTEVIDGTSHTILFVERSKPVCWMDPNSDLTPDELFAEANAADGTLPLVLLDGRVQLFKNLPDVLRADPDGSSPFSPEVFKAYVTRAGGETFPQ